MYIKSAISKFGKRCYLSNISAESHSRSYECREKFLFADAYMSKRSIARIQSRSRIVYREIVSLRLSLYTERERNRHRCSLFLAVFLLSTPVPSCRCKCHACFLVLLPLVARSYPRESLIYWSQNRRAYGLGERVCSSAARLTRPLGPEKANGGLPPSSLFSTLGALYRYL